MLYAIFNVDKPGTAALRLEKRPLHKEYLGKVAERIAFAGPLLADDGIAMIGSLLVIDFPHRSAADTWVKEDPFVSAGLYSSVNVYAFQNLWAQKAGFPPAPT